MIVWAKHTRPASKCRVCDSDIYPGEEMYRIPGYGVVCEQCVEEARETAEYPVKEGNDDD